jgi:hypothetical protein
MTLEKNRDTNQGNLIKCIGETGTGGRSQS